ncbi:Sideroflexin-5 [Aphelenchoides bicaudatus]|nr:Sideroflexin-5 [Aphelenchoides bicaudatus]
MTANETQGTLLGYPLYPKFVEGQPRFPTDTFMSRYLNYLDVIDPRTLLASNVSRSKATNQQLWEAQKLRTAIFHPDTDEKILPPFRMSGFVPFGWITVTGMLLPNPSWPTILFWQWANQTHNACVNYANRNASKPQPFSIYAKAYGCAVGAAISVSATLTWFIKRASNLSHTQKLIIQRFVPLPATSLASTLNVLCMRAPELQTGITVYDSNNKEVGASKVAAKKAVFETAVTRAFLPVPLLLAPPCIMPFLEKLKFVQKSAGRHLLVNACVCTISFGLSLPVALALFPQQAKIRREDLETELQERTKDQFLYFNKGL